MRMCRVMASVLLNLHEEIVDGLLLGAAVAGRRAEIVILRHRRPIEPAIGNRLGIVAGDDLGHGATPPLPATPRNAQTTAPRSCGASLPASAARRARQRPSPRRGLAWSAAANCPAGFRDGGAFRARGDCATTGRAPRRPGLLRPWPSPCAGSARTADIRQCGRDGK